MTNLTTFTKHIAYSEFSDFSQRVESSPVKWPIRREFSTTRSPDALSFKAFGGLLREDSRRHRSEGTVSPQTLPQQGLHDRIRRKSQAGALFQVSRALSDAADYLAFSCL